MGIAAPFRAKLTRGHAPRGPWTLCRKAEEVPPSAPPPVKKGIIPRGMGTTGGSTVCAGAGHKDTSHSKADGAYQASLSVWFLGGPTLRDGVWVGEPASANPVRMTKGGLIHVAG